MLRPSEDPCPITVYASRHAAAKRALADAAEEGGGTTDRLPPLEAGTPAKAGKFMPPSVGVLPPAATLALQDDVDEEGVTPVTTAPAARKRQTAAEAKASVLKSLLGRDTEKASRAMKAMKAMKAFMLTTDRSQQGIAQRLRSPQAILTSVA